MKRLLSISLFAVACAALVSPEPAHAGKWKDKWKEKKSKKGKKGKSGHGHGHHDDDDDGHHDDDDDGGGGGGGGGGGSTGKAKVRGAGQRGVASFGGTIVLGQNGPKGIFIVDIHPIAPSGTALSIACRFTRFENFVVTDNRATFRGFGGCRILRTDGSIDITQNTNDFQIVDNPGGDVIDVDFVGESGIAVPGGPVDFGDLVVTPAS
jgi:hypothetical protein